MLWKRKIRNLYLYCKSANTRRMGGLCPTTSNSLRAFREEFYRQNLGQRLQGVWLSLVGGDAPGILCSAWSYHPPPEMGDLVPDAAAKSLHSCPTLCDPIDGSPPGSPVPGIFQARTLEWVAISFSNAWKWKVKVKWLSRVRLLVTPWTAAYQAPPSMGFSRQEYWSGVPLPSPLPG